MGESRFLVGSTKSKPQLPPKIDVEREQGMTVGQVIEALQEYDRDLIVVTEGCDCMGYVGQILKVGGEVVLER